MITVLVVVEFQCDLCRVRKVENRPSNDCFRLPEEWLHGEGDQIHCGVCVSRRGRLARG